MTGYYDVCRAGDEVRNPKKNIPFSVIVTCLIVGVVFLLTYLAVLGSWNYSNYVHMYAGNYTQVPQGIISLLVEEKTGSRVLAGIATVWVCITIMGANYATLCGYAYLPYAAAKNGDFFSIFQHTSKKHDGLADYSLLLVGFCSAIWCLFPLGVVIDVMTTLLVLMQFMGQSFGLIYYRWTVKEEDQEQGWRMPCFPVPCVIQLVLFGLIFSTSDSYLLWGSEKPTERVEAKVKKKPFFSFFVLFIYFSFFFLFFFFFSTRFFLFWKWPWHS